MQIIINAPDNLPQAVIQQQIKEFESKLQHLQKGIKNKNIPNEVFKINEQACLQALSKIKQGDKSDSTNIGNIKDYIESLKNELS